MRIRGQEQVVIKGFTLLEILVVLIIIAILAALALPNFGKAREYALGKEAFANLKLMAAAEKIYRMEQGVYYPSPETTESIVGGINTNLKLSVTEANWDYEIKTTGDPTTTFTASADRQGSGPYSNCKYSINQDQEKPVVDSGTCP